MASNSEERRLWVGNLDTRMTEYHLLKILQKCGNIEKFDMLFHKSGPQIGQPRGYAFVTYKTQEESNKALEKLNGKLIGNKNIVVRLAKNINYDELEKPRPKIDIPVLAVGATKDQIISKEIAIQAIEAKLRSLETKKDDLEINKTVSSETPLIHKYQFNKNTLEGGKTASGSVGGASGSSNAHSHHSSRHHYGKHVRHSSSQPYSKNARHHHRR